MNLHHELIDRAASALGDVDVVFVGGAALPLLYDPGTVARETDDADCIVLVRTRREHAALEAKLRSLGLRQPIENQGPICRWWTADDLVIDVMPVEESVLGFSNRWYEDAFYNAMVCTLDTGRTVRVPAPAWFLATKIEAYRNRGAAFPYGSNDLEDILTLVGGRSVLVDELRALVDARLREYLCAFFADFRSLAEHADLVAGHMAPPRSEARVEAALRRLYCIEEELRGQCRP